MQAEPWNGHMLIAAERALGAGSASEASQETEHQEVEEG